VDKAAFVPSISWRRKTEIITIGQYTSIHSAEATLTRRQVVNREVNIRSGIQLVSENSITVAYNKSKMDLTFFSQEHLGNCGSLLICHIQHESDMTFATQLRLMALCAVVMTALALPEPSLLPSPLPCDGTGADVPQLKHKQVLILGGGVAGILAARKLTEEGITDFVIVEARDELGGRVHSTSFGAPGRQVMVELGASWIQGTQEGNGPENPIFALARKQNVSVAETDYTSVSTSVR